MASDQSFVEYIVDQFAEDCGVTAKKMFGEYGLFSGGKMFAMVCDNRLFFKPTEGGVALMGEVRLAPPYPGAKAIPLIEDRIDDGEWMSELARITVRELPAPKRKTRKKAR
jgi:TfoX/Sxy family transcriptional regulator of competence genes